MNIKLNPFRFSLPLLFVTIFFFSASHHVTAQELKHRISVFSPIYLDSAFNGKTYKLLGNYLPKNMLPGLEFYNGAMMAIDSLNFDATSNLFVDFYDYKGRNNSLSHIIKDSANKLADSKVIIASFNNRSDIKILADYGKEKQIPIISATYPNDGSISDNSYFFLLNPTLRTHCKALYKHLQKHSATSNVIYLTRKGGFEEMVENYFNEIDSNAAAALNLQPIKLVDTFYAKELTSLLDTAKNNIIFCGSVNETFAYKILSTLAPLKKYKISIIGMPTWDALKNLDKSEYKDLEVIYTSSYNYSKTDKLAQRFINKYKAKYNAKPSDIAFKGYETMLRFGKTVSLYGANAVQLFSDDMFKIINQLDMKPVYNKMITTQIDYYENNKIFFIKKVDGVVKSVN
jgi:ABC-type branched-subunit amino acid transport system substrate-binding protein